MQRRERERRERDGQEAVQRRRALCVAREPREQSAVGDEPEVRGGAVVARWGCLDEDCYAFVSVPWSAGV